MLRYLNMSKEVQQRCWRAWKTCPLRSSWGVMQLWLMNEEIACPEIISYSRTNCIPVLCCKLQQSRLGSKEFLDNYSDCSIKKGRSCLSVNINENFSESVLLDFISLTIAWLFLTMIINSHGYWFYISSQMFFY